MSTIVTRAGKGSALTHTEVDANFTNLNTDKIEAAQSVTLTNKTISGSNNTLSNIGNSSLTNSSVTIGSTSVSLGGTAATVSGLTLTSPTVNTATISGGTINNAAIGGTTPAAGSFTSLTDSGNLTFTGTGNRITGDFSNATIANRVMFQNSVTNSASRLGLLPNGTGVNSSWDAWANSDPANSSYGRFGVLGATEVAIQSEKTGTGTYLPMTFYTSGSERMRIDTSGNVGVGTSSPDSRLTVQTAGASNGTVASRSGLLLRADNISTGFANSRIQWTYAGLGTSTKAYIEGGVYGADYLAFSGDGSSEDMRIDTSGNVGIGTSSPGKKLDLFNSGTTTTDFVVRNGTVSLLSFVDGAAAYIGTGTNHPLLFTTNNTERARIDSSGNFLFNSGYGSVATAYGCRAWVNFNGTGTVAIRASGNVSSITDNGTGDYTVNFTTAMPDANYAISALQGTTPGIVTAKLKDNVSPTTSGVRVITINTSFADTDAANISVAIFR